MIFVLGFGINLDKWIQVQLCNVPEIRGYYNNAFYAKVGGISTAEMNLLEVDFLFGLGFQLNVTPTMFHAYCSYLQREMLIQSPLPIVDLPLNMARLQKTHCCFNEDESTHQKQLAV
ncbi:cyclin-U4-1 isoform X2 [Populus trichocarpa]|uniref:cyclin-U4-1 isoform X2 n=1 Tax=Populus trichocarpa TaxID=3694 RepID=UPI000D187E86|nr:cyclin-U4-1 isoform X2 [Populus trichocarpa]|eukprot:XP_024437827.1 cyclin-U4-1 isoform X2 [Populus trichocarpa]